MCESADVSPERQGGTYFLRKEVTRLDAIVIILKLAASAVGLAAAIVGLLREAVAFAKALWATRKKMTASSN